MTQVATFYVFLSRMRIFTLITYKVLFLVFFNTPWFVLFCSPSLFHCLCFSSNRISPVPCPLQGSFVTTTPMDKPSSSWSLFPRDHQHIQFAAVKSSFNLCYYILSLALCSFMSVWDVFVEHSIFTERCRINSTQHRMRQFNLGVFLILPLSKNNHAIIRLLKNS